MNEKPQESYRILIVEDEVLIADTLERFLTKVGHSVVGKAISYEEGVSCFHQTTPDLVLIDIRLNGTRSGIDLGTYLNSRLATPPFIYLTSQMDPATVNLAKSTFPASYLSKPIRSDSLLATVAIVMHNDRKPAGDSRTVTLFDGRFRHRLAIADIEFLRAEHVYVKVVVRGRQPILLRRTFSDLLNELEPEGFIQTHRSYAVNIRLVTRYDRDRVYIGLHSIPLSRGRRKNFTDRLK
jgi:DNA-binding LytR/AlgR family response regulator